MYFFVYLKKHWQMDIQSEKLKLIEWLASLSDQSIIEKLKLFKDNFSDKSDWWETLSDFEKESIDEGIKDIEEGRTIPHTEFLKKYGRSA
jgi:predicted transcriptional regulator